MSCDHDDDLPTIAAASGTDMPAHIFKIFDEEEPDHPWAGDDAGHKCLSCPSDSLWYCDPARHPSNT